MPRTNHAQILVTVLVFSLIPSIAQAASVSLSANPTSQEATTDYAAIYDITITNDGSEDATISLSTSQSDQDCNGFTSSMDTTPLSLGAGESEMRTLTVSVTEQATGDCETTVTAQATGTELGVPSQSDVTVTTSAGSGGQYSVTLTHKTPSDGNVDYDGDGSEVEWTVDVENSGEQDNQVINLVMSSSTSCESEGLSASVDPATMTLNSGDSDIATVSVTLSDGSSTDAGEHCFILEATMNPNTLAEANDSIDLILRIPQVKTCDATIAKQSHTLDPGETATNSFSVRNTGNTDWQVTAFAYNDQGYEVQDWVDFETPTSRTLTEPGGSQDETTFEFTITPDDSVEPGNVDVYIQGRSGSAVGCEKIVKVNLGQIHEASATLSNSRLNNIQPGNIKSTNLQVTNTGNGQDTLSLGVKNIPSGWNVEISPQNTITVDGKHCSSSPNCNKETVQVDVSAPPEAKAGIEYLLTFTLTTSTVTLDETTLTVTVAPFHEGKLTLISDSQTGRLGQWVSFPIELMNIGNTDDAFSLTSCDPSINDSCQSTKWPTRYKDASGNEISSVILDSEENKQLFYEVLVSDNRDNRTEIFEIRIGIVGTQELMSDTVSVTVSIYNYSMAISLENPSDDPKVEDLSIPPGGNGEISFWIDNTGDGGDDESVISISGMDSSILKIIKLNGITITEDSVSVPSNDRVLVEIEFEALEGVDSGTSGVIRVAVSSKKNTGQVPSYIDINVDVRTIHNLVVTLESPDSVESSYPDRMEFVLFVTNLGNTVEEIEILSSESLRGWTVDVLENSNRFNLNPDQSRKVTVRATPPSEMIEDDEYTFTIVVQPKDLPVAGEPIDLTVKSTLGVGSFSEETIQIIIIGIIVGGTILIITIFIRVRRDNKMIKSALTEQEEY